MGRAGRRWLLACCVLVGCDAEVSEIAPPPDAPAPARIGRASRPSAVPDELIVGLRRGADPGLAPSCSDPAHLALFAEVGAELVGTHPRIRACRIRFRSPTTPAALAARADALRMRTDLVRRVEPNHIVYLEQVPAPSDPYFTEQWGLDDVDAREAWTIAIGTSAVKVAIVDSGIESQHPDLVGRVDAARSYNFVDGNADSNDTSGLGHGTMVAGVIGAVTGNAVGIAGLNWNVTLLALKFAREGSGLAAHAAEAIDFAREQGADVINVSWSLEAPDGYLQEALENAANVLVVAAATTDEGGARDLDSFGEFPCVSALPNVLCVTASDSSGAVASSWGATTVDLAAPGVKIWSTFKSPHYRSQDGTSMAAPFVSGVAALIRSRCPYVDVAKLRSALLAGEPVLAQVGVRVASGMRLNARLALERAAELDSSCALRAPGRPVLIE